MSNLSIVLSERPVDDIIPGKTFVQKITPIPTADQLQDKQILVETLYISLDPAMRGWLNDSRSYLPPVKIGEVMRASSIVRVLASKSSQAAVGDIVTTMSAGWTQYAIIKEGRFDPASSLPKTSCATDLISGVGMTGLTAYFGMTKIGEPKAGDLVVVSGAAGATGSVAGQIAKLNGARVVGIAGSDDKARYLTERLGFDVGLNYKAADFKQKFSAATKDLIDVYFDNVGGEILNMALRKAKPFARFVMCGAISQYNLADKDKRGPTNLDRVITMRIKMQGFIVTDFVKEYPVAKQELANWLETGKIKRQEHIIMGGLAKAEQGLVDLFKGVNTGKLLVEVKPVTPKASL
ncbi:putative NADP-dependent oxidoreductase YfmJ [Ceratocystis lukuohia]|uniref:NADP-dependent oxidoreductase YfmJ n=1 Tax=Ceratocystis lukuohia TaxID=2019550 RepID=A0ABR4MNU7_9PEZI